MRPTRRSITAGLASLPMATALPAFAATGDEIATAFRALVFGQSPDAAVAALRLLESVEDPGIAPALILLLRFGRIPPEPVDLMLARLTGDVHSGWFEWMLWQERHPEIAPHPVYMPFKRDILLAIDPNFEVFLKPEHLDPGAMRIRLEEITWGGVRKDGIPSLDNPARIPASEAEYLQWDDLVFGVEINGDARAYPLRIMGWHEMFNEVIGGVPLALAYCTLCGAGILFETQVEGRAEPFVFGSSGFLYRSNKLMFDRETHSLWNQFTGEPVVGPLAASGIRLRQRPVVIASWNDWRAANPGTTVLSLDTGHSRDYGPGVVYSDYFASPDLMFPALVDESRLAQKDYVFGIRTFAAAKAWPMAAFAGGRIINDRVGDLAVVLVGDASGRTVRAYERGALEFRTAEEGLSADGVSWELREDGLHAADGRTLPRVAGHVAYWFAWDGYLGAASELWSE